jgi:hypothetical protein
MRPDDVAKKTLADTAHSDFNTMEETASNTLSRNSHHRGAAQFDFNR